MHRATYHFTGRSHWALCSCGWRSPLHAVKTVVEAAFTKHKKESP